MTGKYINFQLKVYTIKTKEFTYPHPEVSKSMCSRSIQAMKGMGKGWAPSDSTECINGLSCRATRNVVI